MDWANLMFSVDDSAGESWLSLSSVANRLEADVESLSISRSESSSRGGGVGCCSRSIGSNSCNEGAPSVSSIFGAGCLNRRVSSGWFT